MKYFMMSNKFDKLTYFDFGLVSINGKFIKAADMSEWEACSLYNFGWGKEYGFYRKPLGNFDFLLNIVFSDDEEDMYAAAAIILDRYPFELKTFLKNEVITNNKEYDLERLEKVFKLMYPLNRTMKIGMDISEIKKEMDDWTLIAQYFNEHLLLSK